MIKKKIFTAIIPRNIGDIDFIFPLFEFLKKTNKGVNLNIIYLSFSKYTIRKKDRLFEKSLKKMSIKEYDIIDLLKINISLKSKIRTYFNNDNYLTEDLNYYVNKKDFNISKNLTYILKYLKIKIQQLFFFSIFFFFYDQKLLNKFKSDFYFVSQRNILSTLLRNIFEKIVKFNPKSIFFLYPHGPHYINRTLESYGDTSKIIVNDSKNFEFWYSFNDEKPWMNKQLNLKKHKCNCVSYPFLKPKKKIRKKNKKKNILVIPRKFAPAHKKILSSVGTTSYIEMIKYLKPLKNLQWNFNLIIKPHPASNILELKKMLKNLDIKNYSITEKSFRYIYKEIDLLYGYFSTLILSAVSSKIPVFYYEDEILKNCRAKIKKMYKDITFFHFNNNNLEKKIVKTLKKNNYNNSKLNKYFKSSFLSLTSNRIKKNVQPTF